MAAKHEVRKTPVRVALWCVPRTTSTVLTKCLCGIEDITVFFEQYTYNACFRSVYKTSMDQNLPAKLEGNEKAYQEALALWKSIHGYGLPIEKLT